MPQFRNIKISRFKINVKPINFLHRLFPYFVGNKVKFKLQIIDTQSKMDSTTLNLFEIFNGDEKILCGIGSAEINGNWINKIGFPIDREGDIIYRIGLSSKSTYAEPIILGYVINIDRWVFVVLGYVLGILTPRINLFEIINTIIKILKIK